MPLAKQQRVFDNEEMRALDKRLKTGTFPPDLRQFMEECLQTRHQEAAKPDQVDDDDWHQQRLKREATGTPQL